VIEESPSPDTVEDKQAYNFAALREEVDRMKSEREAERKEYQAQMEMLRVNMAQKTSPTQAKEERKFLDGMRDDDVPSVAELRREFEQREAAYVSRLNELQVVQQHPDYAEVIQNYTSKIVQNEPDALEVIQKSANPALTAYKMGKKEQRIAELEAKLQGHTSQTQQPQQPQISENAKRIVANSKKPGTLSQAGGQGALSKADYYASMSDEEFAKFASKQLESI
jgi:hypothetical protein